MTPWESSRYTASAAGAHQELRLLPDSPYRSLNGSGCVIRLNQWTDLRPGRRHTREFLRQSGLFSSSDLVRNHDWQCGGKFAYGK